MLKRGIALFLSALMLLSTVPIRIYSQEVPQKELTQMTEEKPAEITVEEIAETEELDTLLEKEGNADAVAAETREPDFSETEATTEEIQEPETSETEAAAEEIQEQEPFEMEAATEETMVSEILELETAAPEKSSRRMPDSIYGDNGEYFFESFSDLVYICTYGISDANYLYYYGDGPLVIEHNLKLPEDYYIMCYLAQDSTITVPKGVTLTNKAAIQADNLVINGTMLNYRTCTVQKRLEINGTLNLYAGMMLDADTKVTGKGSLISEDPYSHLYKYTQCNTFTEFRNLLKKAIEDGSRVTYSIAWENYDNPNMVLQESVKIPSNVSFSIGNDDTTFTIPNDVTLEVNAEDACFFYGDVVIKGSLKNNATLRSEGTISFSGGSYAGKGKLCILDVYDDNKLSRYLSGLDLDQFEKQKTWIDYGNYWILQKEEKDYISKGTAGDASWKIGKDGTLYITGKGKLEVSRLENAYQLPWNDYISQITEIRIEEGITEISDEAFWNMAILKAISLPNTLSRIGDRTFYGCSALKSISIPTSVTEIGSSPFVGCSSLAEIHVDKNNRYFCSQSDVLFRIDAGNPVHLIAYPIARKGSSYTVPEGVRSIGENAFFGNHSLNQVNLPDTLTAIGSYAFEDTNLTSITIPTNVKEIGVCAFRDCDQLKNIYFLGDPPQIALDAFAGYDAKSKVNANAYIPSANTKWTSSKRINYGGMIRWISSFYTNIIGAAEITGGKSQKFTAEIFSANQKVSKVNWYMKEGDEEFVTLKKSGLSVTVTAEDVSEVRTVTLIADPGNGVAPAQYTFTILPRVKELVLYEVWQDENSITQYKDLSEYAWWYYTLGSWSQNGFSTQMKAVAIPDGASCAVIWSSSNSKVATINQNGELYFTGKPGSTVITATATDGSGAKATVLWKAIAPVTNVEPVGDSLIELVGGKSTTLKIRNRDTQKNISNKDIRWRLLTEDGNDASAYGSIDSSGKMTTKKVVERITVVAFGDVYTDNLLTGCVTYTIILCPEATHVEIYGPEGIVTGKTILFDLNLRQELLLEAVVMPKDAMPTEVEWYTSDGKHVYSEYNPLVMGNIIQMYGPSGKTGIVTLRVKAGDGSNRTANVRVQFGRFAQSVQIQNRQTALTSGSTMELKASVKPENVTKPGVTWSLADPADKAYVSLSGSKLTAKTVYDRKTVTLIATSKDGKASATCTVDIVPKDTAMLAIYNYNSGENVTKSTVYVDLNDTNPQVVLSAGDLFGNYCQASWKYADTDNVEIYPSGNRLQVIMNKPGSVKITAEYGSRTATVTVKAAKLATGMYITTKDGKNLDVDKNGSWFVQVASGKNVELKAKVHNAASSKVTWSIVSGGEYAKISSSGKLTANKNVTSTKKVVVQATTEDGSRLQERIPVFVKPLATGIMVYTLEKDAQMRTLALSNNERMINRSNTQLIWDMNTNPVFWVYSTVFPFFENDSIGSAIQTVTWKSSSPKVATISSNGMVTCQKPGTATITCSAADGSGQKISFKLTVVKRMERITLKDAVVVAGKSITLKPDISPEDTTNKKLEWRIEGDTAFASVDSNGKLTARKVTAIKSVTVFAVAADGSGVYGKCTVWIYPKSVKSVSILSGNKDVSGDTLTLRVGNSINLNYMITPYNAPMDVTWSSSDNGCASVKDGSVKAIKAGKIVTITCTANDGSGKKATVKIKIV